MKTPFSKDAKQFRKYFVLLFLFFAMAACHGKASDNSNSAAVTVAAGSGIFVKTAEVTTKNLDQVSTINFVVHTKPGNMSKNINVAYSLDYLNREGYVNATAGTIDVPVFGLYPGYLNNVDVIVNWADNTSTTTSLTMQTDDFISQYKMTGITINKQYVNPDVSYLLIDSSPVSPIIVDIDGEVRWQSDVLGNVALPVHFVIPVYFDGSGFIEGEYEGSQLFKINPIGDVALSSMLSDTRYSEIHHDIEPGKQGLLATVAFQDNSDPANVIISPASVLIEMTPQGGILNSWDFNAIVGGAISSKGEDPSTFVQNNVDWFHMNAAIYSPQDDSLIVSSRENFVLKIDYTTKKIKWILGNPGKQWYQNYPLSLQPLALSITGKAPIGQHALSIVNDPNHLLLFNNGNGNLVLPYIGDTRTYSAVSLYEIDEAAMTANEIWTFDDNQALYSPICGSAFKTASGLYVVDFATTESQAAARIMIIDDSKNIYFDMRIPSRAIDPSSCLTAYRAREIKLDSLSIQ